jgi:hypothetical protein
VIASVMASVLAHQGGWDEMLFVLVPIAVFAWLLSMANKRAIKEQASREETDSAPVDDDEPD